MKFAYEGKDLFILVAVEAATVATAFYLTTGA